MKKLYEYEITTTKVKELEIPKKFEFRFIKDEDEWTDEEWELNEEYCEWVDEQLGVEDGILGEWGIIR